MMMGGVELGVPEVFCGGMTGVEVVAGIVDVAIGIVLVATGAVDVATGIVVVATGGVVVARGNMFADASIVDAVVPLRQRT